MQIVSERLNDSEDRVRCAALKTLSAILVASKPSVARTEVADTGEGMTTILGAEEDERRWEELAATLRLQLLRLLEVTN